MKSVRGTRDLVGPAYQLYNDFRNTYQKHMELYGFTGIETPIIEHASLFAGNSEIGQTSDIVSKEMYLVNSWSEVKQKQEISFDTILRPEGTIPCVRAIIAAGLLDESFLRLHYSGPMFRYNRPQKGRGRQFTQFGCEVLNADNPYVDVEIIQCLHSFFAKFDLKYTLHINTLGSKSSLEGYRKHLYDHLVQNKHHLTELNQQRLDTNVMRVLDQLNHDEKNSLRNDFPNILDYLTPEEQNRFEIVCNSLSQYGIDYVIDPYLVRGLDYYRNTVFELVTDDFTLGAGGAYSFDKAKFIEGKKSQDIYGFGWAFGYERVEPLLSMEPIKKIKLFINAVDIAYGSEITKYFRDNGVICYPSYGPDKNYLKKAGYLGADYIITCEADMKASNTIKVKSFEVENTLTPKEFISSLKKRQSDNLK